MLMSSHLGNQAKAVGLIKCLTENGANVNATDDCGRTALHRAMNNGSHEIALALVELGADLGSEDDSGSTPIDFYLESIGREFHYVPMKEEPGLRTLINGEGDTLLHQAVRNDSLIELRLWLKCSDVLTRSDVGGLRINVQARNNQGLTALELAERQPPPDYGFTVPELAEPFGHTYLLSVLQEAVQLDKERKRLQTRHL